MRTLFATAVGVATIAAVAAVVVGVGVFMTRVCYIPTDGSWRDTASLGVATLTLAGFCFLVSFFVGHIVVSVYYDE